MRTLRLVHAAVAAFALCLLSATALAQPGGGPPPPPAGGGYYGGAPYTPGFARKGLTLGFGFGLGSMSADSGPIECFDCSYDPVAGGIDGHLGAFISPRLAIMGELAGTGQTLDSVGANVLVQTMLLGAVQYWITPQFWIKGGLGIAALSLSYDDGYEATSDTIDQGGAIMGAAGFEILHSQRFAIDLQLRLAAGAYDGIDQQINSGMLNLGFNWYQ